MPQINEILAPYYLIIKYANNVARHDMTVYFETGTTLPAPNVLTPNDWPVQGVGAVAAERISDIVHQLFSRMSPSLGAGTRVTEIQLWQSQTGQNVFLHSNDLPTSNSYGGTGGIASAYYMLVFSTAQRKKYKLTYFEWNDSRPQRYAGVNPPVLDDGTVQWYVLRSVVPFATNDGIRLTTNFSTHTGYNRALAKRYGKVIVP